MRSRSRSTGWNKFVDGNLGAAWPSDDEMTSLVHDNWKTRRRRIGHATRIGSSYLNINYSQQGTRLTLISRARECVCVFFFSFFLSFEHSVRVIRYPNQCFDMRFLRVNCYCQVSYIFRGVVRGRVEIHVIVKRVYKIVNSYVLCPEIT